LAETPLNAALIRTRLDDSLTLVEQTATCIRDVMASLRPPLLDDYGLVAALRWYGNLLASRAGFTLTVKDELSSSLPRLAAPIENALFRIAQEALVNVTKHAQASLATISIWGDKDSVCLVVADNGWGFELPGPAKMNGRPSWGLMTMAERAEAVGGVCRIASQLGQGTQVTVEVKL
jgi:two-component system sensor histidine kinase UhpB